MKIIKFAILWLASLAISVATVWAGPVGIQRSLSPAQASVALSQLRAEQQRVDRQLPEPPKGPALITYMDRRSELHDLMNRIESGQPVSPGEIDEALHPIYR